MDTEPTVVQHTVVPSGELPRLVVVQGHEIGRAFPLAKETTTIGRNPKGDIVLPFPTVSWSHAAIVVRRGQIVAHDLGSRNGTFVGVDRIVHCVLAEGDVLAVGDRVALKLTLRAGLESGAGTVGRQVRTWAPREVNVAALLERLREERSAARAAAVSLVLLFVRVDEAAALEDLVRRTRDACSGALEVDDLLARASDRELILLVRGTVERAMRTAERIRARTRGAGVPSVALVPLPMHGSLGEETLLLVASQRAGYALCRAPHSISTVRLDTALGPRAE